MVMQGESHPEKIKNAPRSSRENSAFQLPHACCEKSERDGERRLCVQSGLRLWFLCRARCALRIPRSWTCSPTGQSFCWSTQIQFHAVESPAPSEVQKIERCTHMYPSIWQTAQVHRIKHRLLTRPDGLGKIGYDYCKHLHARLLYIYIYYSLLILFYTIYLELPPEQVNCD